MPPAACGGSPALDADIAAGVGGDGGGNADGNAAGPSRGPAGAATCKRCLHKDVCKAYDLAMDTNDRFAVLNFIRLDTPVIVAHRLAERCTKYAPPDMVGINGGDINDLR